MGCGHPTRLMGGDRWRGRATASGAGGESSVHGPGLHLLYPAVLEPEIGYELGEGGLGNRGEIRRGIAKVLIETGGERVEKKIIINLRTNVAELVSESHEAATIFIHGGIILMTPENSCCKKDAPLETIVGEESIELGSDGVDIITIAHDHVKQVR